MDTRLTAMPTDNKLRIRAVCRGVAAPFALPRAGKLAAMRPLEDDEQLLSGHQGMFLKAFKSSQSTRPTPVTSSVS